MATEWLCILIWTTTPQVHKSVGKGDQWSLTAAEWSLKSNSNKSRNVLLASGVYSKIQPSIPDLFLLFPIFLILKVIWTFQLKTKSSVSLSLPLPNFTTLVNVLLLHPSLSLSLTFPLIRRSPMISQTHSHPSFDSPFLLLRLDIIGRWHSSAVIYEWLTDRRILCTADSDSLRSMRSTFDWISFVTCSRCCCSYGRPDKEGLI